MIIPMYHWLGMMNQRTGRMNQRMEDRTAETPYQLFLHQSLSHTCHLHQRTLCQMSHHLQDLRIDWLVVENDRDVKWRSGSVTWSAGGPLSWNVMGVFRSLRVS